LPSSISNLIASTNMYHRSFSKLGVEVLLNLPFR
jgi:hypothetical protein